MRALAIAAALAFLTCGCHTTARCRPNSLFVHLDSAAAPIAAGSTLHVSVTFASGRTLTTDVTAKSGSGLEIDFDAADYMAGQSVDISIELHDSSGTILATAEASGVTLPPTCATASLSLSPGQVVDNDMGTSGPIDLAGSNFANGSPCGAGSQCQSGFCVDGVCCNMGCGGQCEACDATGTCVAVTSGQPTGSRAACAGSGTCAGSCSSASRSVCSYPGASTICVQQSCTAGVKTLATGCDGAGMCPTAGTFNCPSNSCAGSDCVGACTDDTMCSAPTPFCNLPQGVCLATKGLGAMCTAGSQCTSTFCTDGVCCNVACGGQCQACNLTGNVGHCATVASGQPVTNAGTTRAACAGSGACQGTCNGTSATMCVLPGSSVTCGSPSCMNATLTPAPTCNGSGSCVAGSASACPGDLVCASATACKPSCAGDGDCIAARYCAASTSACTMQKAQGVACNLATDCKMSPCAECATAGGCQTGFCCNAACGGACQSCAAASGATANGSCTTLAAGSAGNPSCSPYVCNGAIATCPTSCAVNTDCVPTHGFCSGNVCGTCFVAGTPVQTETGWQAIETIAPGARVRSFDTQKGEESYRAVVRNEQRIAGSLVSVALDGAAPIEVSPEHYFWVRSSGWVRARDLAVDDQLLMDRRGNARVVGLASLATPALGVPVYNLVVEGFDNYFVGTTPVLVHSCDYLGYSAFARDELPK
jgi:hypothetical protein